MNDNVILTEKKDAVLLITINRPEKLNALNANVLDALNDTLEIFLKDDTLKGAIITGSGEKAFVAGADISGFLKGDRNMGADFAAKGQTLFSSIENASKPIIAAVNGFALGGGCELAMSCHFRIASENAKFGQPEVNLGLIPGIGGTQRLKRSAGKYNANYLCMTGDIISAQQAHNIGVVSVVLKAEEFKEGAMKILKSISEKPLSSLVEIKRLINKDASLKDERQTFYKLLDGENKYIGIKSFFEKTKPEWK